MGKKLFHILKNIIMGLAVVFFLVGLLLLLAQRTSGAEVEINIHQGSGTGHGRSINSQHYDPTAVNELTADVYQYMYHEHIPRIYRRDDRTNRDDFDDGYEIEIEGDND